MVPGNILIYSFPETSRQEMKREKKKSHENEKSDGFTNWDFFFMLMLKFQVHIFQNHPNVTNSLKKCPRGTFLLFIK